MLRQVDPCNDGMTNYEKVCYQRKSFTEGCVIGKVGQGGVGEGVEGLF